MVGRLKSYAMTRVRGEAVLPSHLSSVCGSTGASLKVVRGGTPRKLGPARSVSTCCWGHWADAA